MMIYSDKHLESVPVEYIVALENFLNDDSIAHCSSCPLILAGINRNPFSVIGVCVACPEFMKYGSTCCPCTYYEEFEEAKEAGLNLINQWKEWSEIT